MKMKPATCMGVFFSLLILAKPALSLDYSLDSLSFTTSLQLAGPDDLGMNAKSFAAPESAEAGQETFSVVFVSFPKEQIAAMQMDDQGLIAYAKSTFLGTAKPASETKEITIFGEKCAGEALSTKIPKPSRIEVYITGMPDESRLVLAFKWDPTAVNELDAEKHIREIADTLTRKQP